MLKITAITFVLKDYRFLFFICALGLYAVLGSPTPDNPGWVESLIAILLILSLEYTGLVQNFSFSLNSKVENWRLGALILFIYGLVVPTIAGLWQGAPITIIVRDIAGLLFLCLPLFFYIFLKGNGFKEKGFLLACLGIGVIFSLRVLFPEKDSIELLYLANSPLVLFSALFLFFFAARKLFFDKDAGHIFLGLLCFVGAAIALLAMFIDIQRASFIALLLSTVVMFVIGFVKAPLRIILPIIVTSVVVFTFHAVFMEILQGITTKTAQVGMNMRFQELQAIWEVSNDSWLYTLFGHGWGSSFTSPAVGGLHVTYTHSLLSYMFFKTGLIGLFLCLVYLFFVFEKLVHLYFSDPVRGNALMWPFAIPIFLYASHKSFDFGLLLTLILVMGTSSAIKNKVTA